MNKNIFVRTAALLLSCLIFTLAGCSDEEADNPSSPTVIYTITPQPTATTAPTTEPTAIPTPTELPKEAESIAELLPLLRRAGIIVSKESSPAAADVLGNSVEIETVETLFDHFVIVTLNGWLTTVNTEDIALIKNNVNWSTYQKVTSNLTITDSYAAVNKEGKTVLIYQVADILQGTSAVFDKKASSFSDLAAAVTIADNYVSWQMDHGGWDKGVDNQAKKPWDGKTKKNVTSGWTGIHGEMLGTIDNDATYTQMRHIAAVYREVPDDKYKDSVLRGLDFLFQLQCESGGFAQVYPKRGNYSDNVTFNDNAMVHVLYLLEDMLYHRYPFDSDIIPEEYLDKIEVSLDKAIDFILKSQITSQGKLTAWCAQHDPVTYEPVGARAYELASISGNESIAIIQFLMNQEQTPEITLAVESAIQWLKESELTGIEYIRNDSKGVYFVETPGFRTWYRFYEIGTNLPIFCDRDGVMKHNILEIGEERRHGYSWAGDWAKKLLNAYDKYGYFTGTIEAVVVESNSSTSDGKSLKPDSAKTAEQVLSLN